MTFVGGRSSIDDNGGALLRRCRDGFMAHSFFIVSAAILMIETGISHANAIDVTTGRNASKYMAQDGSSASTAKESAVGGSQDVRKVNVRTRPLTTGSVVRARDAMAPKATTSIERGVRVTRGAPSRRILSNTLENDLAGKSARFSAPNPQQYDVQPQVIVKKEKVVVYRQCVKPRRLKFHGPFEGVRVYHRPIGGLAFDSFGFGSNNRFKPRLCGQGRLGIKTS